MMECSFDTWGDIGFIAVWFVLGGLLGYSMTRAYYIIMHIRPMKGTMYLMQRKIDGHMF